MTTVEKIINLLNENNIEQQKFASDIGVTKQSISEWKSGKTKSYMKCIDRIADYFGVTIDYLLSNETPVSYNISNNSNNGNNIIGRQATGEELKNVDEMTLELIKRFNILPFDKKIEVFNYIKALSEQ